MGHCLVLTFVASWAFFLLSYSFFMVQLLLFRISLQYVRGAKEFCFYDLIENENRLLSMTKCRKKTAKK